MERVMIVITVGMAAFFAVAPASPPLPQETATPPQVAHVFQAEEAAQTLPALLVTDAGYFYLVADEDGVPAVQPVPQIVRLGSGAPPDATPTPTPENATVKKIRELTTAVNDPGGAQALAIVYRTVAQSVEDGRIKPADGFAAVKQATEEVFKASHTDPEKWKAWRSSVGELIADAQRNGGLTDKGSIATFLQDVSKGLEGATADAGAMDPELIRAIIELILKIIEVFGSRGGSPV